MSVSMQTPKEQRKSPRKSLPETPFMLFKHRNGDVVTLTSTGVRPPKYWPASRWLSLVSIQRGSTVSRNDPAAIAISEQIEKLQLEAMDAAEKGDLETVINSLVECEALERPLGGGFAHNDLSEAIFEEEWARILRFIKGADMYSADGHSWLPVS